MDEREHLSDTLDIASRITDELNAVNVAAARAKAKPDQVPDADGNYLIRECQYRLYDGYDGLCGEPIEEERLKLGYVICAECAHAKERALKRRSFR